MLWSRLPAITAEMHAKVIAAVAEGAEQVADDARERVPVASGRLRDAIHVDHQDDGVHVIAGDTDAWYGHLVEYGTARTPARPFLVPALEATRTEIVAGVKTVLGRL